MSKNSNNRANGVEKSPFHRPAPSTIWGAACSLFPVLMGLLLLSVGLFYNIPARQAGKKYDLSGVRLLASTVTSARDALVGGKLSAGERNYYILLLLGAAVALLVAALAFFLACWGAWHTYRHVRGSAEEKKQARLSYRLLLPAPPAPLVAACLYMIPAAFPAYFSALSTRFLEFAGGTDILYITRNTPLIVAAVLAALYAMLLLLGRRYIRNSPYDLFAAQHPSPEMTEKEEKTE